MFLPANCASPRDAVDEKRLFQTEQEGKRNCKKDEPQMADYGTADYGLLTTDQRPKTRDQGPGTKG